MKHKKSVQDYDSNGDKLLDLAEYVKAVFGEGAGEVEWMEGKQQFEKDRDLDHDGVLDWEEVRQWMLPEAYDEHQVRDCCDVTHMYDVYNIIDYMIYFTCTTISMIMYCLELFLLLK